METEMMETYTTEHLKRWTSPQNYIGPQWFDYYGSGVGRTGDSDALERANFQAMLNALGFEGETAPDDCPRYGADDDPDAGSEPTRIIVRASHWAVGWVEWIAIHESDGAGLKIADDIAERLENYPIIDEELYSDYEWTECEEVWARCYDACDRSTYLRKHLHMPHGVFQ